jgi:hypothetical protein
MHQEFEVHLLNDRGIDKAKRLAAYFDDLLCRIEEIMDAEVTSELDSVRKAASHNRSMSIVRTKLEEASFFAKKAMAILPENQRQAVVVDGQRQGGCCSTSS